MMAEQAATKTRRARRYTKTLLEKITSCVFVFFASSWPVGVKAHSGPPFPIVEDRVVGAYKVSIWTDPDATDDHTAAGKFWVTLQPARRGGSVPDATSVRVSIKPLDRVGVEQAAQADRLNDDIQRQFVALLMDHEGRYSVHVAVAGPLGAAGVDSETDATYDLRPRPILTLLFIAPFLLVGFVWGKLLIARKMAARGGR